MAYDHLSEGVDSDTGVGNEGREGRWRHSLSSDDTDVSALEGVELASTEYRWGPRDVALYALSLGAEEAGTGEEVDLTWGSGDPGDLFRLSASCPPWGTPCASTI